MFYVDRYASSHRNNRLWRRYSHHSSHIQRSPEQTSSCYHEGIRKSIRFDSGLSRKVHQTSRCCYLPYSEPLFGSLVWINVNNHIYTKIIQKLSTRYHIHTRIILRNVAWNKKIAWAFRFLHFKQHFNNEDVILQHEGTHFISYLPRQLVVFLF